MSGAFTAKNYNIKKAPKKITLLGDRVKPEPAQHIIEFPGGAIEVSRTSKNEYWAHITINRGQVVDDAEGREAALGRVVGVRVFDSEHGFLEAPIDVDNNSVEQIAVLIKVQR
jgi:hypothetical protein